MGWFEHPTRVEPNLTHAWDKDRLHLNAEGKLLSPGWQERLQKEYSDAFTPLPLEQQPLDGEEYNDKAMSGDGTIANVGLKLTGTFQCPDCKQKFTTKKAQELHWKFIHDPTRHQED